MDTIKQHSAEWYRIKALNFGATDCASLYGVGFNDPSQVVMNKISGSEPSIDEMTQRNMDRGTRYEETVRECCADRRNIAIAETGLKFHKSIPYLTASPDGYCEDGVYLLEFKVRQEMSVKVPEKYWVQMQIQMEVWDVDACLYCENVIKEYLDMESYVKDIERYSKIDSYTGVYGSITEDDGATYYWRLVDFKETMVYRNREWFQDKMYPILERYWKLVEDGRSQDTQPRGKRSAESEPADEETVKRNKYLTCKDQMIMPYMLSNYIRKDPLLDWLSLYGTPDQRDTTPNPFLTMIGRKNKEFHHCVVKYITNLYGEEAYDVDPNPFSATGGEAEVEAHSHNMSYEKLQDTKASMARGVPIIFNPYFTCKLKSYNYPLGGRADMIVRNDYLNRLLGVDDAPDGKYSKKYSIVNFKFASINLRADGTYLLNNTKQSSYKAQLWLLNRMLSYEQKYLPSVCYIIGRKYDYTTKGKKIKINNAFGRVGTIDFLTEDQQYESQCMEALTWLSTIREDDASSWDLYQPGDREEMYPNMKNHNDFPWHEVKGKVAHHINDITLMYKCGPKVRSYAHERGITDWKDLCAETIVYKKGKVMEQIMGFIKGNTGDTPAPKPTHTFKTLHNIPCVEFYMDFESVGNMYDDFSTFPEAADYAMIFLIGVIIVDNVKQTKEYRSYVAERLESSAEQRIVKAMLSDFQEARAQYGQDFSPVYFWSNAENYMLKRAVGEAEMSQQGLLMIDLCKYFRSAEIILPGQMSYGLKDVAKIMKEQSLIKTYWNGEDISDGLAAMIEAIKTYHHRPDHKEDFFRSVMEYNYVDCKVMEEIVSYLRS